MEELIPNQRLGYAKLRIYPTFLENGIITAEDVMKLLKTEYSESRVDKSVLETDHLPFPFKTELLEKEHLYQLDFDYTKFILKSFQSCQGEWENKKEDTHNFKLDLANIQEYIKRHQIGYPCFILHIDNFDPKSEKVHDLYNDMNGFIFGFFYFVVFGTAENGLITLEVALD